MIPPDLDLDERRAAAQPRDFPDDFDKNTGWNVCTDCRRCFIGIATRIQCRICAQRRTL